MELLRGDKQPFSQESSQQTNHYQVARHSTYTKTHIIYIRARALAIRTHQAKKQSQKHDLQGEER